MVKITKVYTKQGDGGETHLGAGKRIVKNSNRIDAIGNIDELNSIIGFALAEIRSKETLTSLTTACLHIQNELFNLGAQLAVLKEDRRDNTPVIKESNINRLEEEIDRYNEKLPSLKSFILPGGGEVASRLHLARTVCRRAERSLLTLQQQSGISLDGTELPYLNRLSDWLFVAARYVAFQLDEEELLWQPH